MATESRSEKPRALKSLGLSDHVKQRILCKNKGKENKKKKDQIKGEG